MIARRATILRGPNGCGKTSDLEAVAGRDLKSLKYIPASRHEGIDSPGFARQGRAVPFLAPSVIGSLVSALVLRGLPLKEAYQKANDLLEITALEYLRERSFRHLSGGEAQIVNVLSAVLSARDGLFLDDPFSMLDGENRTTMRRVLAGLDSYVPPQHSRYLDIVMALIPRSSGIDECSWISAKDCMEIDRYYTPVEQDALRLFVEIGTKIVKERSRTSSIILDNFSLKIYPQPRPLFRPVTEILKPRQCYALRAPNGVGKSLMLAALAGYAARTWGHGFIRFLSFRVYARLKQLGSISWDGIENGRGAFVFVPQHSELLSADVGPQNELIRILEYAGLNYRLGYLDKLKKAGIDERRIGEYSYGEARFISATIALLTALSCADVTWILLDEIDARLDEFRRAIVNQLIQQFLLSGGGVIQATHSGELVSNSVTINLEKY